MKTIEILDMLPSEIYREVVNNIYQQHGDIEAEILLSYRTDESLYDLITNLFDWETSNEGCEYWYDLTTQLA